MLRKNMMNILLALAGIGTLLVGYNAFFNSNSDQDTNATSKLSSYLDLNKAKQDVAEAPITITPSDTAPAVTPEVKPDDSAVPTAEAPAAETPAATPVPADTAPKPDNTSPSRNAAKYTVKEGDTYGCIAEKYYGSFEHYTDVMSANPVAQEGFSEYGLFVGQVIDLPAVASGQLKPASSLCS
jgi:nucleoid-associated protein YgaU